MPDQPTTDAHLTIDGLSAAYGEATVLRDVSLEIRRGEVVTLVGRNGAGKTTLIRAVMGLHRQLRGRIAVNGSDITGLPAHARARLGLGYVPDDRGTYASLSVEEHLTLPQRASGGGQAWPLERIYTAFPVLEKRRHSRGTQLSGGEQQMLALARVLAMGADLLLCDEPTEGLSPVLVAQIGDILREIKAQGVTVLLIEQNVHFATQVADRHYLLAQGEIVDALDNAAVRQRQGELLEYLGM